jgi:hypothetical protein
MNPTNFFKNTTFIICCMIMQSSLAQDKKSDSTTSFSIQIDYLSNYIYNGRADSLKSPYQITTASLHFANGVYTNLITNYLLTPGQKRFDFFELDLGYDYSLGKKISGQLYGSKYFYSGQTNLFNSDITSNIGGSFNIDLGGIQFNHNLDVFFSSKADLQYTPGVEKTVTIKNADNKTWTITPSIYAEISSLNYYESSITQRGLRGPRQPIASGVTSTTTLNSKGMKFLDLNFSIPLNYESKNITFAFTPTYVMPFNKVTTTTVNKTATTTTSFDSTPYAEKNLNNQFNFQIGIGYKF